MKDFPPAVLVETWLHVMNCRNKNISRQKQAIYQKVKAYFGTIELAQLYVEQSKDEEIEIHFL